MKNHRRATRVPSILEGRITFEGQQTYVSCTVRNLSVTGAQIWLPGSVDLPSEFDLEIPKLKETRKVQLIWSKVQFHGVSFLMPLKFHAGEDITGLLEALRTTDHTSLPEPAAARPRSETSSSSREKPSTLWQQLLRRLGGSAT